MMGLQLHLILAVCIVSFVLISAQPHNQMVDQFENLFDSIATNNTRRGGIYHDVLKQEVAREQQAFDTMKVDFQITRNKNAYKKRNFPKKSNGGGKIFAAKRETSVRNKNNDSTTAYPTRWPYPHKPNETDWSAELKTRPSYHVNGHREIDSIFTKILDTLTKGDRKKKAQLTLYHEWFPMDAVNCFDRLRDLITKQCIDWRWNPYAQKFSYIVINMCNAGWLNTADIEDSIVKTCTKRSPTEDMEK